LQMEGPDPLINGSFCPTGRSSVLSADVTLPTPPPAAGMPAWSPPPVVEAPAEPGAPIVGGFEIVGEEIDEEIRGVFLEEFAEEIDNLDAMLHQWRAAPENMEKLRPIRRAYHALKGSGRHGGARALGEFSWKIEKVLNRVLDRSRPPSDAVIGMVDRAFYTLPELQAALRRERSLTSGLVPLQEAADRIAAGDDAMPPEATQVVATEAAVVAPLQAPEAVAGAVQEPPAELVPASIEALLLEILDAEMQGHLQTVGAR